MKPIITVENLSKRYRIGALRAHKSLRDSIAESVRAPLRRLRNGLDNPDENDLGFAGC